MWTYSIDFETHDAEGGVHYGSTAVAAADCRSALDFFLEKNPDAEVREIRRIRHD